MVTEGAGPMSVERCSRRAKESTFWSSCLSAVDCCNPISGARERSPTFKSLHSTPPLLGECAEADCGEHACAARLQSTSADTFEADGSLMTIRRQFEEPSITRSNWVACGK